MKRILKPLLTALFIATFLAGCVGTDFKEPDASALRLGESRTADIVRVMGEPRRTGELLKNSQMLKLMSYAYASVGGEPLYEGVKPARAMSFYTLDDVLVSQVFISSFKADATDFDAGKVPLIVKGTTTRANLIGLLGKPNGQAIYPVAKAPGDRAMVYAYVHVGGSAFHLKVYTKVLTVSLNNSDIVTDVEYVASGEK